MAAPPQDPESKSAPPSEAPATSPAERVTKGSGDAEPPQRRTRAGRHPPVLHLRGLWRNLLAMVLLALVVAATWFASRQPPHPDMFRPIGLWDLGRADWWAYPLERNAFKRTVVRGDLHAVFTLPDAGHVWAVGEGGLILHSADGGSHWEQQRPRRSDASAAGRVAGLGSFGDLLPSAHAQQAPASAPSLPRSANAPPVDTPQQAPPAVTQKSPAATKQATPRTAPSALPPPSNLRILDATPSAAAAKSGTGAASAAPPAAAAASAPAVPQRPDTAPLRSVFFVSATTGWAAGDDGTVIATRDGGSTWTPQSSGTRASLAGVHFARDGLRGWTVGSEGALLATRDGGITWVAQASGTRAWLTVVRFADDGLHGVAAGFDGALLVTRDGGGTWSAPRSGTRENLWDARLEGLLGWAAGNGGTLIATRDGGVTWSAQSIGTRADLRSVFFAGRGQQGWAVGRDGIVLGTRDGGQTWTSQSSGTTSRLNSVQFAADGQRGWAVGTDGTLLASLDGGSTWRAQASGAKAEFSSVSFAGDGLRGWTVGADGTLLATADGGNTWTPQASGTEAMLAKPQVSGDGLRIWAAGSEGSIHMSQDGGRSWTVRATGTGEWLNAVHMAGDGRRGWAVSARGSVLATVDGGTTWTRQASGTEELLFAVHFARDASRGWIVGGGGTVLATLNGGATWTRQVSGTQAALFSVQFSGDGQHGCAVGSGGTVISTADGGTTWGVRPSGTREELLGVHVADPGQRAWAAGYGGTVLATRDGCNTWIRQATGTRVDLLGLHIAADDLRGWAVGSAATLLTTRDGGSTWTEAAPYRRYWAPWYFAVLALATTLLAALFGLVEPIRQGAQAITPEPVEGGAATTLRADQPVFDKSADRLGYRTAVEALSSFIRNRATEPRVTIAVTGEWGTGKSSIMRMLQTDLQRAGFRTAWFNAWHQQQEGRQLTALFNTVRTQAVPRWWGLEFIAALRVRSRLIWGRGWFYKAVAAASAVGCALLLGDLLADGPQTAWANLRANLLHHVLQQQQTAITGASLAKLDPSRKPAAASAASAPAGGATGPAATTAATKALDAEAATPTRAPPDPCLDAAQRRSHRKAEPVRLAVYCDLKRNFVWDHGEDGSHCGVERPDVADLARRCIFDNGADLIATINAHDKDGVLELWPSEVQAIRATAETLPPPPLFRWLESSLLGGLAGFIALLFTKGISVYGLQLSAPLRALLSGADKDKDAGKEAAGTIERYRAEFGLLCDALDGRLVIFIDDLDRCNPATVNSVLEMTNYLVDVGRCFVVLGAAVDRVKLCIVSPVDGKYNPTYADDYLRKLIHIELPVPLRRAELEELLRDRPPDAAASAETRWRDRGRTALQWLAGFGVLAVVALVFLLGSWLHRSGLGEPLRVLDRPMAAEPAAAPAAAGASAVAIAASSPEPATPTLDVGLSAAADPPWPWGWLLLAALGLAAGLGWRWYRRHREQVLIALGGAIRPVDSGRFMQALRLWNPVVVEHDPTPRHVKRFFNRARLFASYESEEARAAKQPATDDAALVAMAALHHVEPSYLERLCTSLVAADQAHADTAAAMRHLPADLGLDPLVLPSDVNPNEAALKLGFAKRFVKAWRTQFDELGLMLKAEQVQRFADRVRGIHVR